MGSLFRKSPRAELEAGRLEEALRLAESAGDHAVRFEALERLGKVDELRAALSGPPLQPEFLRQGYEALLRLHRQAGREDKLDEDFLSLRRIDRTGSQVVAARLLVNGPPVAQAQAAQRIPGQPYQLWQPHEMTHQHFPPQDSQPEMDRFSGGGFVFQVSIMPDSIPLRDATAEALRALLEKEKETFQRSCFCHVIMQRPCETEKMVGLEFCALGPETFMACRIYVDDQQIVRCLAEKPQDQAASFQLRSFVDSFGRARPGWEATILSRLG